MIRKVLAQMHKLAAYDDMMAEISPDLLSQIETDVIRARTGEAINKQMVAAALGNQPWLALAQESASEDTEV